MSVKQALRSLGADRTIWIDDVFGHTLKRLASTMAEYVEIAESCAIPELRSQLERAKRSDQAADLIAEVLSDLTEQRRVEISDAFYAALGQATAASPELSASAVDRVCELLGIKADDRWDFDTALSRLPDLCGGDGDASVNYIVDLKEEGGSETRGLQILLSLGRHGSKGTAFILTNEAVPASEMQREVELRRQIVSENQTHGEVGVPVCVIAKERLLGAAADIDIEESLTIALKRAGLRRSVHEVLWQAKDTLENAFKEAAGRLQQIPPERLESIVVKRGYQEGVSELHVIERALTAHMSKTLREMFGVDDIVRKSAERMRAMRDIALKGAVPTHDEHLAAFYEAEVWETGTLLNKARSPIATGDVFELIADEPTVKSSRRFLLLGQPCDIAVRPDQDRKHDTAFMVCMRGYDGGTLATGEFAVPFPIDGKRWKLMLRDTTVARLTILDLASFRDDGKVQFDVDQQIPPGLLDGLARIYPGRVKRAELVLRQAIDKQADEQQRKQTVAEEEKALAAATAQEGDEVGGAPARRTVKKVKVKSQRFLDTVADSDPALQLTFSTADDFNLIRQPYCGEEIQATKDGRAKAAPRRITWRIQRCGRIRMPYSAAFLEEHIFNVSRRAFDIDYMSEASVNGVSSDIAVEL